MHKLFSANRKNVKGIDKKEKYMKKPYLADYNSSTKQDL